MTVMYENLDAFGDQCVIIFFDCINPNSYPSIHLSILLLMEGNEESIFRALLFGVPFDTLWKVYFLSNIY